MVKSESDKMVQAWYMDESSEDRHQLPHYVSNEELKKIGILFSKINTQDFDADIQKIRTERGYHYADEITINKEAMPDYKEKLKRFHQEHLHSEEEIRFILEGSGYLDVRNVDDNWIRIMIEPGDLLILPAGIYHRFTPDENDYIKLMRLFRERPVWTSYNRPAAEETPARQDYVAHYVKNAEKD